VVVAGAVGLTQAAVLCDARDRLPDRVKTTLEEGGWTGENLPLRADVELALYGVRVLGKRRREGKDEMCLQLISAELGGDVKAAIQGLRMLKHFGLGHVLAGQESR